MVAIIVGVDSGGDARGTNPNPMVEILALFKLNVRDVSSPSNNIDVVHHHHNEDGEGEQWEEEEEEEEGSTSMLSQPHPISFLIIYLRLPLLPHAPTPLPPPTPSRPPPYIPPRTPAPTLIHPHQVHSEYPYHNQRSGRG